MNPVRGTFAGAVYSIMAPRIPLPVPACYECGGGASELVLCGRCIAKYL